MTFVPLHAERAQRDCPAPADQVCRVRREFDAGEVRRHLAAGERFWRDGDAVTAATESDADEVELSGGIQYPMSRIPGTNLWIVTLRVPRLDEATITWFFFPLKNGEPVNNRVVDQKVWRGPAAPPAPREASTLTGRIVHLSIDSKAMQSKRDLVVYEPAARGGEPLAGVVYGGDGGAVNGLAKVLEPLIVSGRAPRVLLVGVVSSPTNEGRINEYLRSVTDGDRAFLAHESFFITEVVPLIEKRYTLPNDPARRATFGMSNSAAWALDMGLRHPELIGRVLAFSPAGRNAALLEPLPAQPPSFFLLGGLLEPDFHDKAVAWSKIFAARQVPFVLREPVAGHDWASWTAHFPEAVIWAFGPPAQSAHGPAAK